MTTGEHTHCFCTQDTGGRIICCKCSTPLEELYDKPELVLMWERMEHEKNNILRREQSEKADYQGKLL